MSYVWKITIDQIDNGKSVGIMGAQQAWDDNLPAEQFRMIDDDGIIYYYGEIQGAEGEEIFTPLDEFGTPSSGCTDIQYKDKDGRWQSA